MSAPHELSIGEVAERAGVNASAVRYYERVGLLRTARRVAGRRRYDEDVFESLALIGLAQDAGFTVAETRVLMHGFDRSTPPSQRWRSMAEKKLEEIAIRIARAERMRELLQRLMRCQCQNFGDCVRSRRAAMAVARRSGEAKRGSAGRRRRGPRLT
jgi:MerR family redox-sensitive transcriptional activator SoxR